MHIHSASICATQSNLWKSAQQITHSIKQNQRKISIKLEENLKNRKEIKIKPRKKTKKVLEKCLVMKRAQHWLRWKCVAWKKHSRASKICPWVNTSSIDLPMSIHRTVDMGNAYMYLPERYTDLSEDKINTLNKTPKIMVYDGKDPADRDRLILDFRDTQTYFADLLTNSEILNDQPQSFWIRKKNQKWFKMY